MCTVAFICVMQRPPPAAGRGTALRGLHETPVGPGKKNRQEGRRDRTPRETALPEGHLTSRGLDSCSQTPRYGSNFLSKGFEPFSIAGLPPAIPFHLHGPTASAAASILGQHREKVSGYQPKWPEGQGNSKLLKYVLSREPVHKKWAERFCLPFKREHTCCCRSFQLILAKRSRFMFKDINVQFSNVIKNLQQDASKVNKSGKWPFDKSYDLQ